VPEADLEKQVPAVFEKMRVEDERVRDWFRIALVSPTRDAGGLPPIATPRRRILEMACLNCKLDGATLVPEIRKPFDVLAEGLLSDNSRGDSRFTIVNEIAGISLARSLFPAAVHFSGASVLELVEPGLYAKRRPF